MENSKEENLTPEQEAEELKGTQPLKEEEVRENIISEYGFNEEDNADTIDKLVEKEIDNSKKLSSAIGQKIKHRDEAEQLKEKLEEKTPQKPKEDDVKIDNTDLDKSIDDKLNEKLEDKALEDLEYSDDLTAEIKQLANLKKVSVKQVLRDPYIVSRVEQFNKEQKTDEATLSRTNNKGGKKSNSFDSPPEVDMNTEEGRKEWEDWKKEMIAKGL